MLPSSHKLNYFPQRPKRKERTKRTKNYSSKPKQSSDSIDATTKLKNEFRSKENCSTTSNAAADRTIVSLLTKGRISQKIGLYGKGKASSTIKRRKVLATIQSSSNVTPVQYQRPASNNPNQTTPTVSSNPVLSTHHPLFVKRKPRHTSRSTGGRNNISLTSSPENNPKSRMDISSSGSVFSGSSPSSVEDCHSMDIIDSDNDDNAIITVSEKIITGLKRKDSFPSSSVYLGGICSELKKVMRQSDSETYKELEDCFLSPYLNGEGCSDGDSTSTQNSILEISADPPPPPPPCSVVIETTDDSGISIPQPQPPLITNPSNDHSMETACCSNIMTSSPIHSSYWGPLHSSVPSMPPPPPTHVNLPRRPLHHHHQPSGDDYMRSSSAVFQPPLSNSVLLSSCAVGLSPPTMMKNSLVERDMLDGLGNDDGCCIVVDRPKIPIYPHKLF